MSSRSLRACAPALVLAMCVLLLPATTATARQGSVSDAVAAGVGSDVGSDVGSAGIGDPYWPLDGNGGIDVVHYDIRDAYDFTHARLSGTTVLTVRATRALSRFNLDFLLPGATVTVDGLVAATERPRPHELQITPQVPIAAGDTFEVVVTYSARPGLRTYAGENNWLADDDEVVTMNQPHMSPWWFPANDHPRDKALFDITVTGPASHQVVSNGLLVDRTVDGRSATTHWRSSSPMAPYLAFFALGRYDLAQGVSDGLPWYVAVSSGLDPETRQVVMRSLRRTPAITAWLAGRLGDYPFESTGGLATALPVGFALENQTRPTYPSNLASDTSTVVHELAHQWFGDSVSVHRWRDIWLNEGFATFMEAAYAEKHGGQSADRWLQRTYHDLRDYSSRSYWRLDLTDPGAGHVFDSQVYDRGGLALQALRNRVGERAFWRVLRTWVETRRHSNATVPQFEALAEKVSGKQLDAFFQAWLRAPRPPADTRANGLR